MSFSLTPFFYVAVVALMFCMYVRSLRFYLMTCVVFSVFQAAAVFNLSFSGDYLIGIQPGYFFSFFGLCLLMRKAWAGSVCCRPMAVPSRTLYLPLLLFGLYGVISLSFPFLFRGLFLVNPPRGGISADNLALLEPALTNLSQAGYLVFNVVFTVLLSIAISKQIKLAASLLKAYFVAGLMVLAFTAAQLLCSYTNIQFPVSLFYSNMAYSQLFFQSIDGIKRLNGTFTEPSVLAFYLSGYYAFTLWHYLSTKKALSCCAAFASGVFLILSTSTSGYISFFIVSATMLMVASKMPAHWFGRVSFLVLLVFVFAYAALRFGIWRAGTNIIEKTSVESLLSSTLIKKSQTRSFHDRLSTDLTSLRIIPGSFGLGSGLGSTRSSSLITSLMGNLGIPGLALFLCGMFVVLKRLMRLGSFWYPDPKSWMIGGVFFSASASLFVGLLSVPDITFLFLWFHFAVLLGLLVNAERNMAAAPA